MRSAELAKRNFKEVWRDPLSLGLTIGLPVLMLVVLQLFADADAFFSATSLAPGIVLFGFVMLMFSMAMTITRDRESALFKRLLTAPLGANDFTAGYTTPYLPVALVQALVVFGVGMFFGLELGAGMWIVAIVMLLMAVFFIALGVIFGSTMTVRQVPFAYMVILLLTIFGGAWINLEDIGGVLETAGDLFPFAHAMDAARDVMVDGASFTRVASDVYWVVGYTVVFAVLAVVSFRRKMVE
ncbi:MAG: ABC transporter permease [Acidimicrobiia bacterium]|nr:ABC transporter permease [Acidimicrobiia bacterium]NNF68185.1 ABC transporter permease [Acidimicrobiia bacterium]NNK91442.1 ABC transporter permease [Acidimicrobiia bacterium]